MTKHIDVSIRTTDDKWVSCKVDLSHDIPDQYTIQYSISAWLNNPSGFVKLHSNYYLNKNHIISITVGEVGSDT